MRWWSVISLMVLLSGCGSQPLRTDTVPLPAGAGTVLSDESAYVRDQLLQQYRQWQGVPYRLGGNTAQGIDCSGFTQLTFDHRFSVGLPRTTVLQSSAGEAVERQVLQPGDLVFFKTGQKLHHVGVYLGRDEFLHASTSRGVMVSRLDNRYWSPRYWQARRIDGLADGCCSR